MDSPYLELLMVGLLGVVMGFARSDQIALVVSHPYLLSVLYCLYLAVITFSDVTLPLQTAGVILTIALLYIAGTAGAESGAAWHYTILLGQYSLLGYISQIAILQGLRRISWLYQYGVLALISSLLLGVLLTVMAVGIVDLARRKSKVADGLYQFVFG